REREEQHHFDDEDGALEIARRVRLHAAVVRLWMTLGAEPEEGEEEEPAPSDEQDEHEDVDPGDQAVDLLPVGRREEWKSEPVRRHQVFDLWSSDHSVSSSASRLSFACFRR